MIRAQRRAHLVFWCVIAPVLLLLGVLLFRADATPPTHAAIVGAQPVGDAR